MNLKHITVLITLSLNCITTVQSRDCKNDSTYLAMRTEMSHAFNTGDSTDFFKSVTKLED